MKILISGGGLAGMTLAYWLHRDGHTPVVIERAQEIRNGGYGIDFFGTGYDVAERMGITERLMARKLPIDYVAYVNESGKKIATLPMQLMQKIMYRKYAPLMHWTLEEALYDTIKEDVEVRFGRSLQAVEQNTDTVNVRFDDGTTETFDLLIGADGIHSNTRTLVFGPESQFGRYLGYYVASYPVTDHYGIGHAWNNYTEPGRQVGVYASGSGVGDDEGESAKLTTFFMYQAPDEGYIPSNQRLSRLRVAFADMDWITAQLLEDVTDPEHIFMDTVTQIEVPCWHQGRVALVGDACACLTLISGQGASMAMGGAYILAQALHEHGDDYTTAFEQFEARMRPEIEKRQKSARDFAKAFVPGSRLTLFLQQIVMKVILRDAFIGVLRRQFGAESILTGTA